MKESRSRNWLREGQRSERERERERKGLEKKEKGRVRYRQGKEWKWEGNGDRFPDIVIFAIESTDMTIFCVQIFKSSEGERRERRGEDSLRFFNIDRSPSNMKS